MATDDFDRIRILFPDTFGFARGKYVPVEQATGKLNCSLTIFGIGYDKDLIPAPGAGVLEGMRDMQAVYDAKSATRSWQDRTGLLIADLLEGGKPLEIAPRTALRSAVASLAETGYSAQVGIELEAYVLERGTDDNWVPWDTPSAFCYGTGVTVDPIGLIDEIMDAARYSGIQVETAASEYDSPQFELAVHHSDPISAVDNAFLLRLLCREKAAEQGLRMTFLGRPLGDRGGSGLHVHLSLQAPDGSNAFYEPKAHDGLSPTARHAIAGILAHHEALTALCAPTVNAYKRLLPGQLSGYWANWGYDHRSVAVRVPSDRGDGTRLESRLADGSANPYLATAALLQACRLGIEGELDLPPPEEGDGLEKANTERCCPENLSMALDALEADLNLVAALGAPIISHFVAMKRAEWARFSRAVTDWELNEYLSYH